jgi:hydroxyacylglutathione hydrolase
MDYFPVPAFQDNYIWVISDGRSAAVVDPGDAAPVITFLRQRGLRLSAILLTHHHQDHVGGVAELLRSEARGDVPVYGPGAEAIPTVTHSVAGQDRVWIDAPAMSLEVIDVPGHTRGHIAYFDAATGSGAAGVDAGTEPGTELGTIGAIAAPRLFCGDTLFASGCGRLFEGTPQQMLASLDALAALPDATWVHCAHEYTLSNLKFALACEPRNAALIAWSEQAAALRSRGVPTLPTTLAHERAVNPFLRVERDDVKDRLAEEFGQRPADRLASFTRLREWKNNFG